MNKLLKKDNKTLEDIKSSIESEIQNHIKEIDNLTLTIILNLIDRLDNFRKILLSEKEYKNSDVIVSIRIHLVNLSNLAMTPFFGRQKQALSELEELKNKLSKIKF